MSKFSKLKNNPKLFFQDFVKKRLSFLDKEVVNSVNYAELLEALPNDYQKNSIAKNSNAEGYHYYLKNYDASQINDKQIMFDSFWGRKIGCHPYALYRQFRVDPFFKDYLFIWVKEPDVQAPHDTLTDSRVRFVDYSSEDYAIALLSSKILISNSNLAPYFSPKKDQYLVSTWHGIPIKTLGYEANPSYESAYNTQRNLNVSDLIVSSSQYYTEKVVHAYGTSLTLDKVLEAGSPRIDLLLDSGVKKIKALLGVPSNRKVLLYAPTWRGAIGEVSNDIEIQVGLIKLLEEKYSQDYEIYVSLHHLTKKALGDLSQLSIKEVPGYIEINEFMSICDVVISDYSSIFLDYFILNKPVILYVPDLLEYKTERGLYLELEELPVNIAKSLDDLDALLCGSLKKPSKFDTYSAMKRDLIPLEDGKSSERVIEHIKSDIAKVTEDTVPANNSNKQKLLIATGGLKHNGITKSLFNLLNNMDYDKFDVYLLVNAKIIDKSPDAKENLESLNPLCKIILTIAPQNFNQKEKNSYQKILKGQDLKQDEEVALANAWVRENSRLFGKTKFDFVIDYTGYSPYWSNLLAFNSAEKKIIWLHSDMQAEYENVDRKNAGLCGVFSSYKYYDQLVSVSQELSSLNQETLKSYAGQATFTYLPNFITPDSIVSQSLEPLSLLSPETFLLTLEKELTIFTCVARLSPEKDHIRLLNAFNIAVNEGCNAVLIIVGAGPLETKLRNLCKKLKLVNRVVFTGFLYNPYPIVAKSDCLVLASKYEGQGIVFLEAMTLGTYCLGSDIPVIRNLLVDQGGDVFELNSRSLADAMIKVHQNKNNLPVKFIAEHYIEKCKDQLVNEVLK